MTERILLDVPQRGKNHWLLKIVTYQNSVRVDWRRWWHFEGKLKASGAGVTFPLERLPELRRAIEAWEAEQALCAPLDKP
jgi:hypothetical protein